MTASPTQATTSQYDASEFVKHVPCESCGSSDGNSLYDDGHTHCFVCQAHTGATDGTGPGGVLRPPPSSKGSSEFLGGDFRAIPSRRLSAQACQKYGYRITEDRLGRTCQVADYRSSDGTLVAQKIRYSDKSFSVIGGGNTMPLFGQNLWSGGGKRLIITEGEIDAISVAQVLGLSWPAVSVPNGAAGALKSIKANLEFVESFEQVIFAFDMDEPGRKAAKECAEVLTPGKAFIAELPLKDPNECLKADQVKALTTALWQARCVRPDGIVGLDDITDKVMADVQTGYPWFLEGLTNATFGRRIGDVIGLGAGTGIGKTDFLTQQVAYDVNELGLTVGVLFLEQSVADTGRRVAGKIAGKRLHVPDGSWDQNDLKVAWEALRRTGRLHLYDSWGVADWATIRSRIRYMHEALGCQVIYLDHMTALAAAEDDERKALEVIMAEAAGIAQNRFVFHYVSHLTTPEGKSHEEGGRVTIRQFKGSRALGYWSFFMLGMERNQQASDPMERQTTTLRVLKDRFTGRSTGMTWELEYDEKTGLLSEKTGGGAFDVGTEDF